MRLAIGLLSLVLTAPVLQCRAIVRESVPVQQAAAQQCPPAVLLKGPWLLVKQVMADECKTSDMCAQVAACQAELVVAAAQCQQLPVKVCAVDLWHELIAEVRRHVRDNTYKIFGFHWDRNHVLERAGVIKLIHPSIHQQTGTIFCSMQIDQVYKPRAALFPATWSLHVIVEHIVDSFKNIVKTFKERGRHVVVGRTRDNLLVQTVIDEKGAIVTSYPIQQVNSRVDCLALEIF